MSSISTPAFSFVGRRKNNEDSFIYCFEPAPEFCLYAVADGMGGAKAGEVASSLATDTICRFFSEKLKLDTELSDGEIKNIIKEGYSRIQQVIAESVRDNPEFAGMGTTLVILLRAKQKWFWANIGDSRIYQIKKNSIKLLTKDHSYLQQYIDTHGQHPDVEWIRRYSNYVIKALDGGDNEPDVFQFEAGNERDAEDSCFLLCSDGLLPLKDSGVEIPIARIVQSSANSCEAVEQLISYAFYNGSSDNITAILVEGPDFKRKSSRYKRLPFPPSDKVKGTIKVSKSITNLLLIVTGLIICIIAISYLFLKPVQLQGNNEKPEPGVSGLIIQKPTIHNKKMIQNSKWFAFDPDEYRLPVVDSTVLIWNKPEDSFNVSSYSVHIDLEGIDIDSIETNARITSLKFGDFKHLKRGQSYRVSIEAIQGNDSVITGNNFTFNYH
jgi:protein phosphatase